MKIVIREKRNPKPEDLEEALKGFGDDEDASELPEEKEEEHDEDADEAAEASAFDDFLRAIGGDTKRADKAREAFKEFLRHCGYSK